MAELPDLGDHCTLSSCQTLDFLPIKCDLCCLKFCKEHFSYVSHNCAKYKEIDKIKSTNNDTSPIPLYSCSIETCKTKELISILCQQCKLNFCVQHRLQLDHKCKFIDSSNSDNQSKKPKLNEFKFELKTDVSEKNTNLASKLVIMKLKQTAVGPPGLPEESKFYCFIDYKNSKKPFFLSNKWPVGRSQEFISQKLNIKPSNNEYSLRFENGDLIDKSLIIQELVDKQMLKQAAILKLN
jgi:predicted nucleic acid binding AN1-type Zn finger protein